MNLHIINGNALHIPLPDKSVQMCVTSPPYYGLRDYGTAKWVGGDPDCKHYIAGDGETGQTKAGLKQQTNTGSMRTAKNQCPQCGAIRQDSQIGLEQTPDEYVANIVAVFREVKRVLHNDGVLWLNLGDSYASMKSRYNQKPQNLNGGKSQDNIFQGNKRDLYNHKDLGLKDKDLIGIPWRVAFALQADGWTLRSDIIWNKPNPMPESVKDRPTKSHEYIFLLSKQARYYYDADAIMEESNDPQGILDRYRYKFWGEGTKESSGQGRPNNDANTSGYKNLKFVGQQPNTMVTGRTGEKHSGYKNPDGSLRIQEKDGIPARNKRSVWTVTTKPYSGAHFATFPPDLIEPCIKAGSRPGDTVLDPFNGSGTTGEVCARYERNYIGIELNRDYINLTRERLSVFLLQPKLI